MGEEPPERHDDEERQRERAKEGKSHVGLSRMTEDSETGARETGARETRPLPARRSEKAAALAAALRANLRRRKAGGLDKAEPVNGPGTEPEK